MVQVAALVFLTRDDQLLLVEQDYDQGFWSLPGGLVEANETIEQAAVREVREETGLDVRLLRTVGIYRKNQENSVAITFEAEEVGGELLPAREIRAGRFFPFDELPSHVRDHFAQRVKDFSEADGGILFRAE